MPMAIELGRMVTYHDRLSPVKSHKPFITRQIKPIISPLIQCILTRNLVGW